ncbi:MAG: hypothetical protein ACRDMV_17970 [Streptosporangiales bacterium]
MSWASTVPAAVEALVAAFTDALPDAVVRDGPVVTSSGAQEVVTVGYTGTEGENAVEGTLRVQGLAVSPSRETYTVWCAASVARGSGDIAKARAAAYGLLAGCGAALAADQTLGGPVMSARLGDARLVQSKTPKSAAVTVVFGVDVDAYSVR